MKTIFKHIEQIKSRPHHVRKKIAFTAAASGTAAIAFLWMVGNISSGTFALNDSSFADVVGQKSLEAGGTNNLQNFAGAAAALETSGAPARIEIVDTSSSTRSVKRPEPTTIPF